MKADLCLLTSRSVLQINENPALCGKGGCVGGVNPKWLMALASVAHMQCGVCGVYV